ncbi:SIS domain-containing protein [Aureimonas sp. AU4]|uniref:SIS domain-containing protein n=1 Tax=Aureimonas sp. AU4 TaxID=1638163 RepID=UPI000782A974|nr:SIS domain-containing protein [Aureimonas sp. AU4]
MTADPTLMSLELRQTPAVVAEMLQREAGALAALGRSLRERGPAFVVTSARGSSDNAVGFFKYLVEILVGLPVASMGPSVASIYEANLRVRGALVLSVSQSGGSPDIVALQRAAREGGALAVAVVNDAASPLAREADTVLPIGAGEERSVAATKTCLASAVMLAALAAEWADDEGLRQGLKRLPDAFAKALEANWDTALDLLVPARSCYLVGRGPAFPVAVEAALKLKETAVLHAEAFSAAEVMHGPLQLLTPDFPVIAFRPRDAAFGATGQAVERLRQAGGRVLVAEAGEGRDTLPVTASAHPLLDPLVMLLSFYDLAERVSRARGHDPDRPAHLAKVTRTV